MHLFIFCTVFNCFFFIKTNWHNAVILDLSNTFKKNNNHNSSIVPVFISVVKKLLKQW